MAPTSWRCGPEDAARRVAVVAQESAVEFDFSVFEMVMIGRTPHKRAFDRDDQSDHAIVCRCHRPGRLRSSNGPQLPYAFWRRKTAGLIARAIAQGADHLILDEPTNHLDIRYQVEVLELVAGLGVTVLSSAPRPQPRQPLLRRRPLARRWPSRHRRASPIGDHLRDRASRVRG